MTPPTNREGWKVVLEGRGTNPNVGDWAVDTEDGVSIATYCTKKNARKIAALPELLAALEAMISAEDMPVDLKDHKSNSAYFAAQAEALDLARAAIVKAKP